MGVQSPSTLPTQTTALCVSDLMGIANCNYCYQKPKQITATR